jgi:hypothetical protein
VFDSVGGTIWASHAISGVLGVVSQYPDAYAYLLSQLKTSGPFNKTRFLAIQNMSYPEAHIFYNGQNINDYFINNASILQAPLIKKALQVNTFMGYHGVPRVPVFVYKAIHDEVTLVGDTDAWVQRSCLLGASVFYQRNTVGGHQDEFTNGDERAFGWLGSLFDGSLGEMVVQNVTVDVVDTGL